MLNKRSLRWPRSAVLPRWSTPPATRRPLRRRVRPKQAVERTSQWIELTSEQCNSCAALCMIADARPALRTRPAHQDRRPLGRIVFFIDGDKACTPMAFPTASTMMDDVADRPTATKEARSAVTRQARALKRRMTHQLAIGASQADTLGLQSLSFSGYHSHRLRFTFTAT